MATESTPALLLLTEFTLKAAKSERLQRMRMGKIDRNSIHPLSLYKRMADNLDDHDCPDCNGTGFVEVDTGGGNSRTAFCKCPKGQELAEADERAREAKEYDDMEGER